MKEEPGVHGSRPVKGSSGSQVRVCVCVRGRGRAGGGGGGEGVTLLVVWVLRDANEASRLAWINVAAYCWLSVAAERGLARLGCRQLHNSFDDVVVVALVLFGNWKPQLVQADMQLSSFDASSPPRPHVFVFLQGRFGFSVFMSLEHITSTSINQDPL